MTKRAAFYLLMAVSLIVVSAWVEARADAPATDALAPQAEAEADDVVAITDVANEDNADEAAPVDLFDAIDEGSVEVKFIAKSDRRGRIVIDNQTDEAIDLVIPRAFVGVPVLAQQFGGGGGGFGGGGGGGGQQSVGGGGGGLGGGGGGFGGGGGGQFSIPPAETTKIDVPLLCLDHGLKDPSSSKPYKLVRADQHLAKKPEVIELLAAFGNGQLQRGAAQAAVWHANSEVSWAELAAKLNGTARSVSRSPYFSRAEIQAAVSYVAEAVRRAADYESPAESEEAASPYDDEVSVEG